MSRQTLKGTVSGEITFDTDDILQVVISGSSRTYEVELKLKDGRGGFWTPLYYGNLREANAIYQKVKEMMHDDKLTITWGEQDNEPSAFPGDTLTSDSDPETPQE